jgi:nitrogenase molybdenum-iron protein beta chain
MVKCLSESTGVTNNKINLISGWVEPSDMREIKRIANQMGAKFTLFPDTSDVVDAPQTGNYQMYPKGGTKVPDLIAAGDNKATLAFGEWATADAATKLEIKCKVPFEVTELPIGVRATDRFIMKMSQLAEVSIPDEITAERGRLVDMITDMQQYLNGKRVALWGDPDQLIPLTEFLLDMNMKPVYIISGTPGKKMHKKLEELVLPIIPEAKFKNGLGADMFLMHQWIKDEGVDLLIGNTYGKYISRDENTPLLRMGFPILDRVGHSYFPTLGYMGGIRILEKILNLIMDKQDAESTETEFELVM